MPRPPIVAVTASTREVGGNVKVLVNRAYTDSVRAVGLIPLVIPPVSAAEVPSLLDAVDGLVLTGGEDIEPALFGEKRHPKAGPANAQRDECELALAREAARRQMPTLAICRGIQVLNVALGGTLVQDIPSQVSTSLEHDAEGKRNVRVHEVAVVAGTRLSEIVGTTEIRANSFHHQSVERVADGLEITGRSPDGVIEAVECSDRAWWAVGVQWHPEELTGTVEDWDRKLFAAFAMAVRKHSSSGQESR